MGFFLCVCGFVENCDKNSSEIQMVLKERASSGQINNNYSWPAIFQWIGFK